MAKKVQSAKLKVQSSNPLPGGKLNNFLNNFSEKILKLRRSKIFYILLIALGLLAIFIYKKSWIVAATVNGYPITNLELQTRLNKQFRTQTLTSLINEKIILTEAAKNNAVATEEELNKKLAEIEKQVGGAGVLDSLLEQQGQNRDGIRQQLKLQVSIEKLYAGEATVSAEEVAKFLEENKDTLRATDSAEQAKEAEEVIRSQKISQVFSQKFQELRSKAKIQIF